MRPVASGQGLLLAVKAIIFNMIYEHDAMNYRKIIDNNFVYQCTLPFLFGCLKLTPIGR